MSEILDACTNVGRSTFYTHFRDKDELLGSGGFGICKSCRFGGLAAVEP